MSSSSSHIFLVTSKALCCSFLSVVSSKLNGCRTSSKQLPLHRISNRNTPYYTVLATSIWMMQLTRIIAVFRLLKTDRNFCNIRSYTFACRNIVRLSFWNHFFQRAQHHRYCDVQSYQPRIRIVTAAIRDCCSASTVQSYNNSVYVRWHSFHCGN